MAVFRFSALSDGQVIFFNPRIDVLEFDQTAISAADLRLTDTGDVRVEVVSGSLAGKGVILVETTAEQLSTTNVTFANGSALLTGNNSANNIVGTAGNDQLVGLGGNDTMLGGGAANLLQGGAGNDTLDGSSGNDTLRGGTGNDSMRGGSGNDQFVFDEGGSADADRITDFLSGTDKLAFQVGPFYSAIGPTGNFAAGDGRFVAGAGFTSGRDANDRLIYNNTTTGQLFYDADGSGAGAAQLVATLNGAPALAATDITVI